MSTGPSLVTRVHAQTQAHVLIAGWIDDNGETHTLECCGNDAALPVWVVNR
jgi:hypothetical protein